MSADLRRLGKYELQRLVGRGGIVEVWQAYDSQARCPVSIKLFRPDLASDPGFLERFEREAKLLKTLRHPNIVQVHDFQIARPPAVENTVAYLVMDDIKEQQLADYIRGTSGRKNFPAKETLVQIFAPICAAVDYMHQQGVIHRNINPTNIVLDTGNTSRNTVGEPMLTGLGVAAMLSVSSSPRPGVLQGNPNYLAPEQMQGYRGNEFSDIYSLGVILYEMCTGALPFQASDTGSSSALHTSTNTGTNTIPTAPALFNPDIPPPLTMVLLHSLAREPARRFASASVLAVETAEALNVALPDGLAPAGFAAGGVDLPTYLTPAPQTSSPSWPLTGASVPQVEARATPQDALSASSPLPSVVLATPPSSTNGGQLPHQAAASNGSGMPIKHTPPGLSTIILPKPTEAAPQLPAKRRRRRGLTVALIAMVLLLLGAIAVGVFYLLPRTGSGGVANTKTVGQAFFVSSGEVSRYTDQGINDGLRINLEHVDAPAPGKSYYAWLLGDIDQSEAPSIPLGQLTVVHGMASLSYSDKHHTNLLAIASRLLITEEDARIAPAQPSLDQSKWKYMAEFAQTRDAKDNFSLLDHLRHLLSGESKLDALGLRGGLASWFARNTELVMIWAGSARDYWKNQDVNGIRAQLIRIQDVLDSAAYVQVERDVPAGTPLLINAPIALLEFDIQKQNPPGYLDHIGRHLRGIIAAPGATTAQIKLARKINQELSSVLSWLEQVRQNARQLLSISDHRQLLSQESLATLNTIAALALYAYVGQLDPTTNAVVPGAVQIRDDIALLATFAISPYVQK